jgi:hypothetical protein
MNQLESFDDRNDPNLTLIEKIKDLGHIARENYKNASVNGKVVLGGLMIMTAYEWGPGNETLTPILGGQAVDSSDGLKGVAITAGITGGFTVAQQLTSSWLTRRSVQQFPDVSEKAFSFMNGGSDLDDELRFKPFDKLPPTKKLVYPFLIGTSFVVGRESFVTGSTDDKELKNVGRKSALVAGLSVAAVAGTFDTLDQVVPDGSIAQGVLNFFKTPIPWLGLAGAVFGKDYLRFKKTK